MTCSSLFRSRFLVFTALVVLVVGVVVEAGTVVVEGSEDSSNGVIGGGAEIDLKYLLNS